MQAEGLTKYLDVRGWVLLIRLSKAMMKRFAVKVWVDSGYLDGPDVRFLMISESCLEVEDFVGKVFGINQYFCCYDIDAPELERFLIDVYGVENYPFGMRQRLIVDGFDEEFLIEYIFSLYERDKVYVGITTERAATMKRMIS